MDGAQASCPALTLGRLETRRLFLNISAQPLDASWLEKSVSGFLAIEGPSELPVTASPVFAVCLKSRYGPPSAKPSTANRLLFNKQR